jgi:hypothetical protein
VVEKLMHQSGFAKAPGACITDVWVHGDGKFGFLEFRTVEVSQSCCGSLPLIPHLCTGMQRVNGP